MRTREEWGRLALGATAGAAIATDWIQNYTAVYLIEACALALMAWLAWSAGRIRWHWAMIPLGAAACWPAAQAALGTTVYRYGTVRAGLFGAAGFAVFFAAAQCFGNAGARERMRRAAAAGGCGLAALATVQMFMSGGKVFWVFETGYKDFVMGPFLNRDHYSAVMELALPAAVYQAFTEKRGGWKWAAMAGVMAASVIAGASRAGFATILGELAVCAVPGWIGRGMERGRTWRAAGQVAAATAVLTAVVGWDVLWSRFQQENPWRDRREWTISAVEMARERPWTGFGMGTFEWAYPAYARFDQGLLVNHAHNDWAEWAAEGGVGYVAAMLALAAWSGRLGWRARWAAGVPAVFAHSLVDYNMQTLPVWICACLLMGAGAAAEREYGGEKGRLRRGRESVDRMVGL